jgi:hypothetical protein
VEKELDGSRFKSEEFLLELKIKNSVYRMRKLMRTSYLQSGSLLFFLMWLFSICSEIFGFRDSYYSKWSSSLLDSVIFHNDRACC